eukprot:10201775-Prorocentrum_lima.AAC.1
MDRYKTREGPVLLVKKTGDVTKSSSPTARWPEHSPWSSSSRPDQTPEQTCQKGSLIETPER